MDARLSDETLKNIIVEYRIECAAIRCIIAMFNACRVTLANCEAGEDLAEINNLLETAMAKANDRIEKLDGIAAEALAASRRNDEIRKASPIIQ